MADDTRRPNRRTVLRALAATSVVAGSPIAAASTRRHRNAADAPPRVRLGDLAVEAALFPDRSVAAITTLGLGDGYQVYVVHDVESMDDVVHVERDLTLLSDAEVGVHGVHWTGRSTLRHSQDDVTVERTLSFDGANGHRTVDAQTVTAVDDDPLPVRRTGQVGTSVDIPHPIDCQSAENDCCTNLPFGPDWCIRATASESGHSPECARANPPAMPHGHFAIFPSGNYRGGLDVWIGRSANCIWIGEGHGSNWCTSVCGPGGGRPGLSDLRDAFEEAIERAADAAGIAVSAIVVTALAYYLAASTLAPPTGVPLV
ncbi:hypothetical protein [Haloarchaeobius sp. HRN-SO-5]|uniref:hypothetical protein n=1 Tax=Haloarchaeobius sp. HRN-SO-5 TaxID=3446118 RepID=UPI003EBACBD7